MTTTDTTTMGAILGDTYGDADVLRLAHIPRPGATDAKSLSASTQLVSTGEPGT